jgi:hypothetical protein
MPELPLLALCTAGDGSPLRWTVQVSRLLLDTSVPPFYPTLFVLVTDCLDTVGGLVWTRIKRKAEGEEGTPHQRKLPGRM